MPDFTRRQGTDLAEYLPSETEQSVEALIVCWELLCDGWILGWEDLCIAYRTLWPEKEKPTPPVEKKPWQPPPLKPIPFWICTECAMELIPEALGTTVCERCKAASAARVASRKADRAARAVSRLTL